MSEVMMMPSPWMRVPVLFFPFLLCLSVLNEWWGLQGLSLQNRNLSKFQFVAESQAGRPPAPNVEVAVAGV